MLLRITGSPVPPPDLLANFRRRAEEAVTAGMRGTAAGLLVDLRQQIQRAFPESRRMPTVITGRGYPDRAGAASLEASAMVRARGNSAAEILTAHRGGVVRAAGGALAIPTQEVPRIGGRQLTPREVEARFGAKLELLKPGTLGPKQRNAVLVLRESIKRGRRAGRVTVRREKRLRIMFVLVRQVSLPERLAPDAVVRTWVARAPSLIDQAWNQLGGGR